MVQPVPAASAPAASAAFAEPQRAVSGLWVAAFATAWLGVWMGQLGPFRVELPLQVAAAVGETGHWTDAVLAFGVVSGIAGAFLIVSYPLAGYLSDRTTSRFGRRRPWILGGTLVFAAALIALGAVEDLVLITVCWTLALVGFSTAGSALTALIADVVPVRQRGAIVGWMSTPRAIGIILGVVLFSMVFATAMLGYAVLAAIVVLFVLPVLFVHKDRPITRQERPAGGLGAAIGQLWWPRRAGSDFRWTWVSGVLTNTGNALGTGLLLYWIAYGLDVGIEGASKAFLPLILVYLVSVLVSAPLLGWISDRLARRKLFVVWGALLQAAAAFVLAFIPSYNAAFVAGALLGIGYGAYLAVGQALATQVIPDARDRAKDLGIMNVAYQVPVAVAPLLGAAVVAALGGFTGLFLLAAVATALGAAVISLVSGVR